MRTGTYRSQFKWFLGLIFNEAGIPAITYVAPSISAFASVCLARQQQEHSLAEALLSYTERCKRAMLRDRDGDLPVRG